MKAHEHSAAKFFDVIRSDDRNRIEQPTEVADKPFFHSFERNKKSNSAWNASDEKYCIDEFVGVVADKYCRAIMWNRLFAYNLYFTEESIDYEST